MDQETVASPVVEASSSVVGFSDCPDLPSDFPLQPGDLVRHKAGGPAMVVNLRRSVGFDVTPYETDTADVYECTWFSGDYLNSGKFCREALIKVIG